MTAYFISGLGADKRIFQKLQLPAEISVVHLDWIEPIQGETMLEYCRRFASGIDTSEGFVLVGLSFGGMIATELSQVLHPRQTIIISSAGSRRELPWYFGLARVLRLDALVSSSRIKKPNVLTNWILGAKTKEERLLLAQILKDTSPSFLKWAIRSILGWNREEKPAGVFQIHGSRDKLLPARYVKADINIPGGEHLMVYSLGGKISELLADRLGYGEQAFRK